MTLNKKKWGAGLKQETRAVAFLVMIGMRPYKCIYKCSYHFSEGINRDGYFDLCRGVVEWS